MYGPNKILPDGRRICVINTLPRFFDISFVFIGADKTAKVMAKLAFDQSRGLWLPQEFMELSAEAGHRFYIDLGHTKTASALPACPNRSCADCDHNCGGMTKMASAFGKSKVAVQRKLAEKIKIVPGGSFSMEKLPELESKEPRIPRKAMKKLSSAPLHTSLGALTSMGVVLHPNEFQELLLTKMGEVELLDDLEKGDQVFKETSHSTHVPMDFRREEVSEVIKSVLPEMKGIIAERTAFGLPFALRLDGYKEVSKKALPTPEPVEHSLLDKVSAAYNGYRRNVLMKLAVAAEMVQSDPKLNEAVLGNGLVDMFSKTANTTPVLTLDSVAYFMGAHFSDRNRFNTTAIAEVIAMGNHGLLEEEQ